MLCFFWIDCADDEADEAAERPHLGFRGRLFLDDLLFTFAFNIRLKSFPLGGRVQLRLMDDLLVSAGNRFAMVYSVKMKSTSTTGAEKKMVPVLLL